MEQQFRNGTTDKMEQQLNGTTVEISNNQVHQAATLFNHSNQNISPSVLKYVHILWNNTTDYNPRNTTCLICLLNKRIRLHLKMKTVTFNII